MTYGCETWNINKFLEKNMVTGQHAMKSEKKNVTHYTTSQGLELINTK